MASIFEEAVRIFSKPPFARTDQECRALVPWLRQLSPLLEPHEIDVLIDFIRNCRYQRAAPDHALICRGKFTQSYYLIMKGSVSLHLDGVQAREDLSSASTHPSKDPDVGDIPDPRTSRSVLSTERPLAEPNNGNTITGFGDAQIGQRPKLGKFINSYGAGESLFDCSMFLDIKPVGVTAICDKTTHLLFLTNDLLSDKLREILREEMLNMHSVIQSHPLFFTVPKRLQVLLLMSLHRERFNFDSIVVQQGSPVEKIFIIRSGHANILIESSRHQYQYAHLWPFETETDFYAQEFQWLRESRRSSLMRKYIKPAMRSIKNHQVAVRRKDGYAGVEKWLKNRVISLCTVLSGEVLGDIELSLGLPSYLQTVRTLHHMTVYILAVNGLERIIGRSSEHEAYRNDALGNHVHRKLENRMNTKYGQQVPLLKCLHGVLNETLKNMKKKNSGKRGKKTKRSEGDKNTSSPHLQLPPVKKRSEAINEQNTDGRLGASFLPSLTLSDEETGQRRGPRPSLFERLYGGGQDDDSSDTNGEGSNPRRFKKRRWACRSVLQVREAIQQKIAEDQFKNSQVTKTGTKVERQVLSTKTTPDNELNSVKDALILPRSSVNSSVSNLGISEYPSNDNHETFKINRNQLPEITLTHAKEENECLLQSEDRKTEDSAVGKMNKYSNFTSSKTRLRSHCSPQDPCLNRTLPAVPEESEPIQIEPPSNIPSITNSTEPVNNSSRAQNTELELITSEYPDNWKTLHFGAGETTKIVLAHENLTPRGIESENKNGVTRINKPLGFDNDRQSKMKFPAIEAKGSNYESSNYFLSDLEERLRQFHQENLDSQYKYTLKLPSLKRYEEIEFEVDGETYDGPRPGGKVLIRKRKCRFQGFFAHVKDHKHIHYHIVDSIPNLPIIDPCKITRNM